MIKTEKPAILLATYQGERYVTEQLDSLLKQTFQDWILYIHDDGSKDETVKILKKYADRYPDRICILEGPSCGGARNNFFYLMDSVEAPYYMCCDQDDVWLPDKVEKTFSLLKSIEKEVAPALVFTELRVVDENLTTIAETMSQYQSLDCAGVNFNRLLMQNVVTGCTMMCNRPLRDLLVKPCDRNKVIMHDWWAALIAARFGVLAFLPEPTILYRQHGDNSVGASNASSAGYVMKKMSQSEQIRESLRNTRIQAKEFADTFEAEPHSLAEQYYESEQLSHSRRQQFYKEHGIGKTGTFRKIGLRIWG